MLLLGLLPLSLSCDQKKLIYEKNYEEKVLGEVVRYLITIGSHCHIVYDIIGHPEIRRGADGRGAIVISG